MSQFVDFAFCFMRGMPDQLRQLVASTQVSSPSGACRCPRHVARWHETKRTTVWIISLFVAFVFDFRDRLVMGLTKKGA